MLKIDSSSQDEDEEQKPLWNFQSKNLFKSASSYISFICEQYEPKIKKSLSLSHISTLNLTSRDSTNNPMEVFLNNEISQMDLVHFDTKKKSTSSEEIDQMKEIIYEINKPRQINFNDSILKEITQKFDRPAYLDITSINLISN